MCRKPLQWHLLLIQQHWKPVAVSRLGFYLSEKKKEPSSTPQGPMWGLGCGRSCALCRPSLCVARAVACAYAAHRSCWVEWTLYVMCCCLKVMIGALESGGDIVSVSCCDNEIFILKGDRDIIRLSNSPEGFTNCGYCGTSPIPFPFSNSNSHSTSTIGSTYAAVTASLFQLQILLLM